MKTALALFAAAILVISPAFAQPTPAPVVDQFEI